MRRSTPVSMTATRRALAAWTRPTPAGSCSRAAHHSTGVPAGVPGAVSAVLSAGSLGRQARAAAALELDARRRADRRAAARPGRAGRSPLRARSGDQADLRRRCSAAGLAPAVAARAAALTRMRGAPASGVSVTSRRPVRGAWAVGRRREDESKRRAGSVAERELRVLAHLLRRPRRREHHRGRRPTSTPSSSETNSSICSVDLRADRAAGRREREGDADVAAVDLDPVDQPELDEVESELGVDDVGERVFDLFDRGHGLESMQSLELRVSGARALRAPHRLVDEQPTGPAVLWGRGSLDAEPAPHGALARARGRRATSSSTSASSSFADAVADGRPRDGRAAPAPGRALDAACCGAQPQIQHADRDGRPAPPAGRARRRARAAPRPPPGNADARGGRVP